MFLVKIQNDVYRQKLAVYALEDLSALHSNRTYQDATGSFYIYYMLFNSTHAPTSPSLLNTHEISYPHPTPTPLHHTQHACQSIASYKFVVNLST